MVVQIYLMDDVPLDLLCFPRSVNVDKKIHGGISNAFEVMDDDARGLHRFD
jgi:hypothetical protein